MARPPAIAKPEDDLLYLQLAREIAINHYPIEQILQNFKISSKQWHGIQRNSRFVKYLEEEITAWNGALNTYERTKLKAAAMVEEYLPEGNTRLHDPNENLPAKVELLKWLGRIAGMEKTGADLSGGGGEKFSVTINLGADTSLSFSKGEAPRVINGELEGDDK